jgi:phosphoribosylglycinamide formyltransferase-1
MRKPVFDPRQGKMRIVGLMSGSGKSLITVIEQQKNLEKQGHFPYEVVAIFSDNPRSKAEEIGRQFDIPVIIRDIQAYYSKRGTKITDKKVREEFDTEAVEALARYSAHVALYTGYTWATTYPLVNAFIGVNAHPADLSIEKDGKRAYAGANGVRAVLAAGEKTVACTTHLVTTQVDGGPILMISRSIPVGWGTKSFEELEKECLGLLKEEAHRLFPKVTKALAEGLFQRDEKGLLYYGDIPIPRGLRENS